MMTIGNTYGTFLNLFKGREDYFAQQHESYYCPVPKPLDSFYLDQHLAGDATYGIYVLTSNSCCHFFCIDIDIPKAELEGTNFTDRTAKYAHLGPCVRETIQTLSGILGIPHEALLLEDTGGRGYHIWVFLKEAMPCDSIVTFGAILKSRLSFEIEFFPKQGKLAPPTRKFGNLIKLPLGLHRKYHARSVFFTMLNGEPQYVDDLTLNLELLNQVVPVAPAAVLATVNANPAVAAQPVSVESEIVKGDRQRPLFKGNLTTLTTHCAAIQRLRSKAEEGRPLSRAEAFHFTNVLLSAEQGLDYVVETIRSAYGSQYNEQKTLGEIERIRSLLPTSCATLVELGFCQDYCREGVRKKNTDPLLTSTTPCGVWLTRVQRNATVESGDLVARIGDSGNVKKGFSQLKAYHEHEDSLFFDPFDYEQFEKDLSSNCSIIAAILREQLPLQLAGYLPIEIPKKLDTEYQLVYRKMSYSTVYDQVPIQAVFNVVAPLIEESFHDCSCGYRWNLDENNPNRIFGDWREAYPRFRGQILETMRNNPNGFHVCCDIKSYYDHIDHAILAEQLRTIIPDPYVLHFITNLIAMYRHDANKAKGLPQGPAYARLLANLYLNDFDAFATNHMSRYLRYVDDLFLFFDSKEAAECGLQEIVRRLHELGLDLSDAEDKRPVITPNNDEALVQQSLDKIQYGMLEGTRQLKHLNCRVVADFADAVERHQASPKTLEELVKLNDYMPALLYVVTEEALLPHPLRSKVWSIVQYLIENHQFCPKRLKTVFYRLLELNPNTEDLARLYESMELAHKVYLVLSVYGAYKTSGKHHDLLERLTLRATQDEYGFLRGFGIAIGSRLGPETRLGLVSTTYIEALVRQNSYFAPAKWASEIPYLSLSDDERAAARQLVHSNCNTLLKLFLFEALSIDTLNYLECKYLCNIIDEEKMTLLPAVCACIVSATRESDLFTKLLGFANSHLALKPLVVAMLSSKLFDLRSGAGRAQIENLRALYEQHVADPEIKRMLLACLERISGDSRPATNGINFAKSHQQLINYNECFLFGRIDSPREYDYLELIPLPRLRQYLPLDIDALKQKVDDLAEQVILPPLKFLYDAGSKEVSLQFQLKPELKLVTKEDFPPGEESSLRILRLVAQIYKKACYFHQKLGKAPCIQVENLLVSKDGNTIVFRTLGMSLRTPYLIVEAKVEDGEKDIPIMIGMLLGHLVAGDSRAVQEFVKGHHTGIDSFLALLIKKMTSKSPTDAYSCARFDYIVGELTVGVNSGKQQVALLYMRERLKSALFRRNSQRVTWYGVAGALGEQPSHLHEICGSKILHEFAFRDRLTLAFGLRNKLHWVSRQLLNLAMNRESGPPNCNLDQTYAVLVERLLLFSVVGIEVLALTRCIQDVMGQRGRQLVVAQTFTTVQLIAADYQKHYALSEFVAATRSFPVEQAHENAPELNELSLSQMMLQLLLSFEVSIDGNRVTVCPGNAMPLSVFKPLAHACLVKLPRIEADLHMLVSTVFDALRNNDAIVLPTINTNLYDDISILAHDFWHVRKSLRVRRYFGVANGQKYFPPDVTCRSTFGKTVTARATALPGSPLTSKWPASKYAGSWDLHANSVINLVVPDDGLHALLSDLKAGKLCGVKFAYLYSGKAMLLYDLLFVIVTFVLLALCEYGTAAQKDKGGVTALFSSGSVVFKAIMVPLLGKLIFWDIGYWFPKLLSWIKSVHAANDAPVDKSS